MPTLAEYFSEIAVKTLSKVEVQKNASNQRELNGVSPLRQMFGTARREIPYKLIYLADDEDSPSISDGNATWYDSRKDNPNRSAEWRLYGVDHLISKAQPNDLLIIAKLHDEQIVMIVAQKGSTFEHQLKFLVGVGSESVFLNKFKLDIALDKLEATFIKKDILQAIGVLSSPNHSPNSRALDLMLEHYPDKLPPTADLSAFARDTCEAMRDPEDPDLTLIDWLEWETQLFHAFETYKYTPIVKKGFDELDSFLVVAKQLLNSRNSRRGHSLEHHVSELLTRSQLPFERNAITESRKRPDFLFPSSAAYHAPSCNPEKLMMLGVKSTCKDRWRQVLSEANKIHNKHLLTLEHGITENQLAEMRDSKLQLILPREYLELQPTSQQRAIIDFSSFISFAKARLT